MKIYSCIVTLVLTVALAVTKPATANQAEQLSIATNAYLYFYPLITMEYTRRVMSVADVQAKGPKFGANKFNHLRAFPSGDLRSVVRPNFDTLYSLAWVNLDQGPIILSVPAIKDRFFMLTIFDMYADAIAVPGTGSVDQNGQKIVLVPPNWQGELPVNMSQIKATTQTLWVLGRVQTNGIEDYQYIHSLQDGFQLATMNGKPYIDAEFAGNIDRKTATLSQVENLSAIDFFRQAVALAQTHPSHASDWTLLQQMKMLGIDSLGLQDDRLAGLLAKGKTRALQLLDGVAKRSNELVNGWRMTLANIGVYGNNYVSRAYIARIGLGANPPEWAVYPLAILDSSGQQPNASNNYTIHFDANNLPPVKGFWSVTMYDQQGFQVSNELNRFAIGDRDNLIKNADGSITLYIQHEKPSTNKVANWLPAPKSGNIGVTMRLYGPNDAVIFGKWQPPELTIVKN